MLPGNQGLSSVPVVAAFHEPRDRPYDPLISPEYGGPALNTPTVSRLVRIWLAYYENSTIYVAPEDGLDPPTVLVVDPTVESVGLAFDANMNPTLAYKTAGVVKLRWFDSIANSMVTTTFPGADSCNVTTDDKRAAKIGSEDVVFAYTRAGGLYYRLQRDRYTIERLLKASVPGPLLRMGMNQQNRLQFEF